MHTTSPVPAHVAISPPRGLAIAAMVCGIAGAVLGLVPLFGLFALGLGIVAFVLGMIAARRHKVLGFRRPVARAGWILGIVAIVLGVVGLSIVSSALDDLEQDLNEIGVEG